MSKCFFKYRRPASFFSCLLKVYHGLLQIDRVLFAGLPQYVADVLDLGKFLQIFKTEMLKKYLRRSVKDRPADARAPADLFDQRFF